MCPVQEGIVWVDGEFKRGLQNSVQLVEATVKKHAALFEKHTANAGTQSAKEYLKNMRQVFDTGMTSLRDSLSRGIIDQRAFRKLSNELKEAFNQNLRNQMGEVAKGGAAATTEVNRLARALKTVGQEVTDGERKGAQFFSSMRAGADGAAAPFMRLKGLIAGAIGFIATGVAARFVSSSIREAEEAASAWGRLAGAIENTGRNAQQVQPQLETAARAASENTRFGDDEALDGLATLMAETNNYAGSVNNMSLVLDVAVGRKVSLERAARLVAQAMRDGDDAVAKLHKRYDGLAQAEGGVIGGAMKVRKEWKEIKEEFGGAVLGADQATDSLQNMLASLKELRVWVRNNREEIGFMASTLVNATVAATRFVLSLPTRFSNTRRVASNELSWLRSQPQSLASLQAWEIAKSKERTNQQGVADQARLEMNNLRALKKEDRPADFAERWRKANQRLLFAEERIEVLDRVLAGISGDITSKSGGPPDGGGGGLGPSDDQIDKWKKLGEQWREMQKTDLQKQIDQARAFVDALQKSGGTAAEIAKAREQLMLLEEQQKKESAATASFMEKVANLAPRVQKSVQAATSLIKPDAVMLTASALEKFNDQMADAQIKLAKGLISQDEFKKAEEAAAKEFNAHLVRILEGIKTTTPEARKLRDELIKMFKSAADAGDDGAAKIQKIASAVVGVARGLLSAADAMGELDESTRRTLEGIINIAEGVGRIAAGDIVGGGVQILGSLANMLSRGDRDREVMELNESLARLRDAVEENTRVLGGSSTAGLAAGAPAAAQSLFRTAYSTGGVMTPGSLNAIARNPLAMQQLRDLDKMLPGFDLMRLFKDALDDPKKMQEFALALHSAREAVRQAAEHFGQISDSNISGQLARFRAELDLLDLDTPTQQLEHFIDVLEKLGGETGGDFARELRQLVKAGDLEGARARVRDIFTQMRSGQLTAETLAKLFGEGFTAEDIEQILLDANKWLEDIANGEGGGVTKSVQIARTITEIQAEEVVAWLEDIDHWLRRIFEVISGTDAAAVLTAAAQLGGNGATAAGRAALEAGGERIVQNASRVEFYNCTFNGTDQQSVERVWIATEEARRKRGMRGF